MHGHTILKNDIASFRQDSKLDCLMAIIYYNCSFYVVRELHTPYRQFREYKKCQFYMQCTVNILVRVIIQQFNIASRTVDDHLMGETCWDMKDFIL